MASESDQNRYTCDHCGAIRRALVPCKMEIDWEKRGWEPSGPKSASADKVVHGGMIIM